jgi:hypothetical protein
MAMLMIKCPHTGAELPTGIEIDEITFAHLPEVKAFAFCPSCGREHAWWKGSAWIAECVAVPAEARTVN